MADHHRGRRAQHPSHLREDDTSRSNRAISPSIRGGVLAAALCLVLAGCAGSPEPAPSLTGDPLDGPLSRYLAVVTGFDDPQWRQNKLDEETRLGELVAQCMTDEGFEYIPTVQRTRYSFDRGPDYDPDDAGWVAQWGYGVVREPGGAGAAAVQTDPNAEYLSGLGTSDQDAYYETLLGPDDGGGGGLGAETGGCYGDAYREVRGSDPTLAAEHAPIMAALEEFSATQFDDPAYAEVDSDWAGCLADAEQGGFERQVDAEQSIRDALAASPGDSDSLDELHDREVDLALADLDCREQTDYRARAKTVRDAQEEQFIADHRTELDALVADAQAG